VTLLSLRDIEAARSTLGRLGIVETPCIASAALDLALGTRLFLKLENLQHTGSFKVRGAGNRMAALDAEQRRRGVIAMSAGNHAQGVAFHARAQGMPATIVMPRATPFTKIRRTEALGARVLLEGDTLGESTIFAARHGAVHGLTFIHPYDDALVVAGQGTAVLEMRDTLAACDMLIVPIGGGGLIAGSAIAAKALAPHIRVIGVQSALYPSMLRKIQNDATPIPAGPTLAEGIAVATPGEIPAAIIRDRIDDIVTVDEAAIEAAVDLLLVEGKLLAEGAGAAGVAAILADRPRFAGRRVATILCGGNVDPRIVSSILMRGLAAAGRLARLRVEVPDRPGMLARVTAAIAGAGGNIVEIIHQRLFHDVPVMRADVDLVIETRDREHLRAILDALHAQGLQALELGSHSSSDR
jgi:threonine dehydratase